METDEDIIVDDNKASFDNQDTIGKKNLDKSWSGLYNRWKCGVEKEFEEDPSNKIKMWFFTSSFSSLIFIMYVFMTSTIIPIVAAASFMGLLRLYRKVEIGKMTSFTTLLLTYIPLILLLPFVTFLGCTIYYFIYKIRIQ
jgi:ABC-type bacteriocin/lantibiotic exporter with double-glycine peptidase domain